MERCPIVYWFEGRHLWLLFVNNLGAICSKCTLVSTIISLHCHWWLGRWLSLLDTGIILPLGLVDTSGNRREVAPLSHSLLQLCFLPTLPHSLHYLVHALDLNLLVRSGRMHLINLRFEFTLLSLSLKPVVIRFLVLLVFVFRSVE